MHWTDVVGSLLGILFACGGQEPAPRDAGTGQPDAAVDAASDETECARNADCTDRDFCNGDERCAPGDPAADDRGCVAAASVPCGAEGTCRAEPSPSCTSLCDLVAPPPPDDTCRSDVDCQDGLFCNGAELCRPGTEGADERGCQLSLTIPCFVGQACDEAGECQERDCASGDDWDLDGHASTTCGGDDCDDGDALRYPGHPEVCAGTLPDGRSAGGHDEDCNWATNANPTNPAEDADDDGFVSDQCCNRLRDGSYSCGGDCDDEDPDVHSDQVEVCNGIDDNCDGQVDEALAVLQFRDADGDGFGDALCSAVACPGAAGLVSTGGDCDDTRAGVVPGSLACGGGAAEVLVCEAGAWSPAGPCGGTERCEPQPNGTGSCH